LDVSRKVPSKCFNSSDEALALVLLENNYEMWIAQGEGRVIDPKYTARFIREKGATGDNTKVPSPGYAGWSYLGIKRFMELKRAVEEDRKKPERKLLEGLFLKHMQQLHNATIADQKNRKTMTTEVSNDALLMESEEVWMELVAIPEEEEEEEKDYGVVVIPTEQLQLNSIS